MRRLAILGASGHGKVVADIAEACGWDEIIFFDDNWPAIKRNGPWPVVGNSVSLTNEMNTFTGVFVGIGDNKIRADKLSWLAEISAPVVALIHPSAIISRYAKIGLGAVIMPGVIVNAEASIAEGVILNTSCSIDHDCLIGLCAHISPGARLAGGVQVGTKSWIGIGASIRQSVNIGQNVMVGAGAAVINDLPDAVTAVGVPARIV